MPTYEYECQKCKQVFEKFQTMTAAPLKFCPKCHGRVKRLLGTGAGFIFKGSGFYATDYRSSNYRSGAKSDAPGVSKSDGPDKSGTGGADKAKSESADKAKPEAAGKAKSEGAAKTKPEGGGKAKSAGS